MTVGSRVGTRLVAHFENLDFVRNLLFPFLKILSPMKSGVTGYEISTRGGIACG